MNEQHPRPTGATELWWKHAVVYCLDVETFMDSDGDGVGDFAGLTERVDYLAGLGVTCIWLLPFFPSPNRDDGYDVTDYYNVDARLGTLGDFVEFVRAATERGLRVLVDLPVNHTSDQHPWFQAARQGRDSPYHDYYVWADEEPKDAPPVVFPGEVESTWTYDELADRWYLHHFHPFQPDLNIGNVAVRRELEKMMAFWLELGVSGFRLDALPFLLGQIGHKDDGAADPHTYIRRIRSYVTRRRGDVLLLGEANVEPKALTEYFGEGDEVQMLFDYPVAAGVYLALARGTAAPIQAQLEKLPDIPEPCQWLHFLQIHDEISLERLDADEREEVYEALAPDPTWRVYDRGLRRRLPPLIGGDERVLRCLYSLLLSLPGTPCLFYGDEIGLGDNLDLPSRLSMRTPMQWTSEPSGGFSTAKESDLVRPLATGDFAPAHISVAAQRLQAGSLLDWTRRLVSARRECPELGWGDWRVLDTKSPGVVAWEATWRGSTVIIGHNVSPEPAGCEIGAERCDEVFEIMADQLYSSSTGHPPDGAMELGAYGFRWWKWKGDTLD